MENSLDSVDFRKIDTVCVGSEPGTAIRVNNIGTGYAFVANQGNVGFGTTAPIAPLHVAAPQASQIVMSTTSTNYAHTTWRNAHGGLVGIEGSAAGGLCADTVPYAMVMVNKGALPIQFATTNSVRMVIDPTGNVGIGTTTPSRNFHVKSTTSAQVFFESTGANRYTGLNLNFNGAIVGPSMPLM